MLQKIGKDDIEGSKSNLDMKSVQTRTRTEKTPFLDTFQAVTSA